MLVLTRKLNEKIKIGDDITITIIKLRNNQIRIGIEAPRDVRVLRAELESMATNAINTNERNVDASGNHRFSSVLAASDSATTNETSEVRRNDVTDGLASADEFISSDNHDASGDDYDDGNDKLPGRDGDQSPARSLQIFSGRIGTDGTLRSTKAPLAAFFTAP